MKVRVYPEGCVEQADEYEIRLADELAEAAAEKAAAPSRRRIGAWYTLLRAVVRDAVAQAIREERRRMRDALIEAAKRADDCGHDPSCIRGHNCGTEGRCAATALNAFARHIWCDACHETGEVAGSEDSGPRPCPECRGGGDLEGA